jgi:uncharacterized membrane protein YkoI
MPAPKWLTAAGVAGALVVGGSAVVAVAGTDPSGQPSSTSPESPSPESSSLESSSPTPSPSRTPEASPSGVISSAEAVEIALGELSGSGSSPTVREIDLEFEDGRQIWDVEFVGGHEVEVEAMTGEIVKLELGDDDGDDRDHDNSGPGGGDDDDDDDDGGGDRGRGGHDDGPDHD